ncbi:class I SAM-dependent methyltransferase [candidate division CSSED10-310 bacterium]|uniref:Class I SAM-dependent methyltransferase n=1 Tax=candidate division CSSED10-310 bacterium TaxID=2855610 RepID=A0ABV6YYA4_UNCC1
MAKHLYAQKKKYGEKVIDFNEGIVLLGFTLNFGFWLGYSITLCDISPAMLAVAKQKLDHEDLLDKVQIIECDINRLRFPDQTFDFVLCWDGMSFEAAREFIRVTRKGGGRISVFLSNRCRAALDEFQHNPKAALATLGLESNGTGPDKSVAGYPQRPLSMNVTEARKFFEQEGIKVIEIYAVCGMQDLLSLPQTVRKSRTWNQELFHQVTEMLLALSKEPSTKGFSRHLVLYGERI